MQMTLKPATSILVIINLIVAIYAFLPGQAEYVLQMGGLIPARFFGDSAGILDNVNFLPVLLTPLTYSFINIGLLNFIVAAMLLLLLGSMNERILGWQGLLILFFTGAVTSAIILILFLPNSFIPFSGSFNAVSAIVAAYLLLYPVGQPKPWAGLSAENARPLQLLILWAVLNLAMSFPTNMELLAANVIAPTASFLAGLLLARPLLLWKYRNA
jgi:membrane associated rhomboid family serine protease